MEQQILSGGQPTWPLEPLLSTTRPTDHAVALTLSQGCWVKPGILGRDSSKHLDAGRTPGGWLHAVCGQPSLHAGITMRKLAEDLRVQRQR